MLELSLELLELTGDSLILSSEILVLFFKGLVRTVVFLPQVAQFSVQYTLLFLQLFIIGVVFLSLFLQHFKVVVKFFSIELIQGLHFLIAFFQVLNITFHFFLQARVHLHSLYSELFNSSFKLFLGFLSVICK